jgi:D-alanyl-D-alanine carboxypeptidase (penicillin-binding protein 5/6)
VTRRIAVRAAASAWAGSGRRTAATALCATAARRTAAAALCATAALVAVPGAAIALSAPRLGVSGAVLIEESTGQRLYGMNPDARLPIASTTKLMTALLTLEHEQRLSRMFTAPDYYSSSVDSQIGLVPGERMSVHDLLLALLIPSADDAAEDLAFNVGHGSVGHFIGEMNVRARQLGLAHTHYSTPIGLDTAGNYSSASDLVKLASFELTHHPFFARVVALPDAVLSTGNHRRYVINRNDLVGRVPWIDGVKTGHTSGAGYVLVGSGKRDGMTLISAVLGTSGESARDANTLALLDYGFANFRLATPVLAGSVIANPTVRDRPGVRVNVIAASTFTRVVLRTTRLTTRVEIPHQLAGPLKRQAVVGDVRVLANGRTIARIALLLTRALPAVSSLTLAAHFLTRPSTLVSLVVLLGAVIGLAGVWRWRLRAREAARPEAA